MSAIVCCISVCLLAISTSAFAANPNIAIQTRQSSVDFRKDDQKEVKIGAVLPEVGACMLI